MRDLLHIPESVLQENKLGVMHVMELFKSQNWKELNEIIVSKDHFGSPASKFGDEYWDLSSSVDTKITNKKGIFFSEIASEYLCIEMKLICFYWIYVAGKPRSGPAIKTTTLISRHSKLNQIFKFLDSFAFKSIETLSHPLVFSEFCSFIKNQRYSDGNCRQIFLIAANLRRTVGVLPFAFSIPTDLSPRELAKEYAAKDKLEKDQFYAIPTRLMELIYGKALSIIEDVHPYRELIHSLLTDLHDNYLLGKREVDVKIDSGQWQWLKRNDPAYRIEVNKFKPSKDREIIASYILGTPLEQLVPINGSRFKGWITNVQTACYVVCAAFTGMRRSELYGLTADSFKARVFDNQEYYFLQSQHHKMVQGRPQTCEWLTVPIASKAIELAEALSRNMRIQLLKDGDPVRVHISDCLWLNQCRKATFPNVRFEGSLRTHFNKIAKAAGAYITEIDLDEFKLINPNCNPQHADEKIQLGKLWPLTSHQCRRSFAVFAKRHDLCSSVAIKQQFKHLDVPTSDWYGEGGLDSKLSYFQLDVELKGFLRDVQHEMVTEKIHDWLNSKDELYGKMGRSIMKERKTTAQIFSS
ncbi:MAG: integrase, partial [Gammaproteobacteria bacterium]|nr:integrase [Gammaproteobacteria bacterium]